MNPAHLMILAVGVVASVVVFLIMRYPGLRRAQYRERAASSAGAAMLASAGIFALFAWLQL